MLDFVIPSSKDDLLTANGQRYTAVNIVSPSELLSTFKVCKRALLDHGFKFILEHFDGLFSLLVHFHRTEWNVLIQGWNVILQGMKAAVEELDVLLKPNLELEEEVRSPACNALKMLSYLLTQSLCAFEEHVKRQVISKASKRKGPQEQIEWFDQLETAVLRLTEVLQLPLIWLWDPPVTEESFLHMFGDAGFTILENPACTTNKRFGTIKDAVMHIFGALVRRYNYGFSFIIRMVMNLGRYEHIATPLVQCTKVLFEEYSTRNIVLQMLQEISYLYDTEVLVGAARTHGQYIGEVAEALPEVFEEHIERVLHLLDQEHAPLRSGILVASAAVLEHCYKGENLPPAKLKLRDELLDILMEHIIDPNGHVRGKALQLWKRLVEERAVPQKVRGQLVEQAAGRVIDTGVLVRKYALQLVGALLKQCPTSAQGGTEQLETELQKAKDRLKELQDKYREGNTRDQRDAQWQCIKPSIGVALEAILSAEDEEEMESDEEEAAEGDKESEVEKKANKDKEEEEDKENKDDEEDKEAQLMHYHGLLLAALEKKSYKDALQHAKVLEKFLPAVCQQMGSFEDAQGRVNFYVTLMGKLYVEESPTALQLSKEQRDALEQEQGQLRMQQFFVDYYEDSVKFMKGMHEALAMVEKMLNWSMLQQQQSSADVVVEAVEILQLAHLVAIPGANNCVTVAMQLILHDPPEAVVNAVADTVKVVYFQCAGVEGMNRAERTVLSLIKLLSTVTEAEALALQELMSVWVKSGDINTHSIQMMWEVFKNPERTSFPEEPHERQLLALRLLTLVAPVMPEKVRSLIPQMSAHVLKAPEEGATEEPNLELAAATCEALCKTCPAIQHNNMATVSDFRLPLDHDLFTGLQALLQTGIMLLKQDHYTPFALASLNLAYHMCLCPDRFAETLLQDLFKALQLKGKGSESQGIKVRVPSRLLTRFVSVIGHVAMMQMVFLDTAVYRKLKSLETDSEKEKEKKKLEKAAKGRQGRKGSASANVSMCSTVSRRTTRGKNGDLNDTGCSQETTFQSTTGEQEDEGTPAEDRIAEALRQVAETELLSPNNILGQLMPYVVEVCSKPKQYSQPDLQRAGLLALSKLMMVSSMVCSDHMQLFVTAMTSAKDEETRSQGVIAMADITFRFPNVVEPWTKYLYERLSDESEKVRLTTVIVLSRLIMSDMVKVRGQISDMALCICDANTCIANAARSFFSELATRHNVLYNVLPDIISRLSAPQLNLSEERFKEIITYILDIVKKDRSVDILVEKFCQRFQTATTTRQSTDIALCLSLLPYSPKGMQKLLDALPLYADKLHDQKIYSYITGIISAHSKSSTKADVKVIAEELQVKIEEVLKAGTEGAGEMAVALARKSRSQLPTPMRRRTPAKAKAPPSAKSTRRKTRGRKLAWSDDDDGEEERLAPIKERPRRGKENITDKGD